MSKKATHKQGHSCATLRKTMDPETLLKTNDMKVTGIRVLLLTLLHAAQKPQSAEDLFTMVKKAKSRKTVDPVTIYRNLTHFLQAGLIQSTELGTGRRLFEWAEQSHHHHHVICQSCKKVDTLEICGLDAHLKTLQKMGYSEVGHRLEFFGTCNDCLKTN